MLLRALSLVAALNAGAPQSGTSPPLLVPPPQQLALRPGAAAHHVGGWAVGVAADASPGVRLAAKLLLNSTGGAAAPVATGRLPASSFVALGVPALDPALAKIAAARNLSVAAHAETLGEEGYLLDIDEHGAVLVAATQRGVFYGVQTLRNLSQATPPGAPISWPTLTIVDYPSKPVRGADVENAPLLTAGGLEWMLRFCDHLALHKMQENVLFRSVALSASLT